MNQGNYKRENTRTGKTSKNQPKPQNIKKKTLIPRGEQDTLNKEQLELLGQEKFTSFEQIEFFDKHELSFLRDIMTQAQIESLYVLRNRRRALVLEYDSSYKPESNTRIFRPYGEAVEYWATEKGLMPVRPSPPKDLVKEGIEPNPGPEFHGGWRTKYVTSSGVPLSGSTIVTLTDPRSNAAGHMFVVEIFFRSSSTAAARPAVLVNFATTDRPNQRISLVDGSSVVLTTGSPMTNITAQMNGAVTGVNAQITLDWYDYVAVTPLLSQPVSTVPSSTPQPVTINGTVPVTGTVSVGNVVTTSGVITNTVNTVTTLAGPADVNVVNGSIPIEFAGGNTSLNVTTNDQPLWVTEFPPHQQSVIAQDAEDDILADGDVEANPGPVDSPTYDGEQLEPAPRHPTKRERLNKINVEASPVVDVEVCPPTSEIQDIVTREEYYHHVEAIAKQKGPIGDYFKELYKALGLDADNRYCCLAVQFEDEPVFEKLKTQRGRPQKQDQERGEKRPLREGKRELTPEEKLAQYQCVVKRVAERIIKNKQVLSRWLTISASPKFRADVLTAVFGEDWEEKKRFDQYEAVAYCFVHRLPREVLAAKLAQFDNKYARYAPLFEASPGADEAENELHNKEMHATNGNVLSKGFSDIEAAPSWKHLIAQKPQHLPRFTGLEAIAGITNVVGNLNPNQTNLFDQDRLRGNIVLADNTITENAVIGIPSTNLMPRQWAFTTNINAPVLNPIDPTANTSEVNVAEYFVNPIQPTELALMVSNNVKNSATSNWRRDNTTLAGFSSFDVASINTTLTPKGLSLEEMLLKVDMLHSVLTLESEWTRIPSTSWSALNGGFTATRQDALLGINDSPAHGEDCGGANAVFPWGGNKGAIAFHLTLESIPIERRSDAIIMPSALLQASVDGTQAIALFAMSWAEWPFGIYTLEKNVDYPQVLGHPVTNFDVKYVPQQCFTHVPGRKNLDIVLPRRYAEANPTTQQAANAQAAIRPETGPAASQALQANSFLNVNYVGGGYQSYPLSEFLYTWALEFDTTTIKQYVGRLAAIMGVKDALESAHELNIALTQLYPKMLLVNDAGIGNNVWDWANNQSAMMDLCFCNHTVVERQQGNFPVRGITKATMRIFETNAMCWNKVCLGLATAPNLKAEALHQVPIHLANPNCHMWERLQSIPMVTSWFAYYSCFGMTVAAWNAAYTSAENYWFQTAARHTFCTSHLTGSIIPAQYGKLIRVLMEQIYERSPAIAHTSIGGEVVEITHFERWLPPKAWASVYQVDSVEIQNPVDPRQFYCFTPVLIPDIWIQYFARKLPKFMMAFPPPSGIDGVQGFHDKLTVHRNNNLDRVGPPIETSVLAVYPINEGPRSDDEIKWNTRLWFSTLFKEIRDYSAGNITEQLPPADVFPGTRYLAFHPEEASPLGNTGWNTMCCPEISVNGSRIVPYLTAQQSVRYVQACHRSNRVMFGAWLLGDVMRQPELQALGSNVKDLFETLTTQTSDFSEATDVQTPASVESVSTVAVSKETLPSSNTGLEPISQPAETSTSAT